MSSLNPLFTIGDQIGETLRAHERIGPAAIKARTIELLDRVGIPSAARRLDDYPHQMSGGQRQRVMIAIALSCNPKLLIADEPTTALDVTIQAQILDLLLELRAERGMAVMLITHNMGVVAEDGGPGAGDVFRRGGGAVAGGLAVRPAGASVYARAAGMRAVAGDGSEAVEGDWRGAAGTRRAGRPGAGLRRDGGLHVAACDAAVPALLPFATAHDAACIRAGQVA